MNNVQRFVGSLADSIGASLTWADRVGVESAVLQVCTTLLAIVTGYAILVTVLGLIGRVATRSGVASHSGQVALALTTGPVRRAMVALIGPSLVASSVLATPGAATATEPEPVTPTTERVASGSRGELADASDESAPEPDPIPTMQLAPEAEEPIDTTVDAPSEIDEQTPVPLDPPDQAPDPAAQPTVGEWRIEPGDHLWRVAEETVAEVRGTTDLADVTSYWLALIETNRSTLVDPDNPDLVYPGQRFVLPPMGGS